MYYFRELKQTKNNMEFKGTKGPWIIDNDSLGFETEIFSDNIRIAQAKHYNRGKDDWTKNDPVLNEGKANAKLISKAPEMLEMLKKITEANASHDGYHELKLKAIQLIKEATNI